MKGFLLGLVVFSVVTLLRDAGVSWAMCVFAVVALGVAFTLVMQP